MARPRFQPNQPKVEKDGKVTVVSLGPDASVRIYEVRNGKRLKPQFTMVWYPGAEQKRQRQYRPTLQRAIDDAIEIVKAMVVGDLEMASKPKRRPTSIQSGKETFQGVPLDKLAEFYFQHHRPLGEHRLVREVADEYIAFRQEHQLRHGRGGNKRWIETLRSGLGKFARRFTGNIDSVTTESLDDFIYDRRQDWSPRTRFNLDAMLRSLFKFAQKRGYLPKQETAIDRLDKPPKPATDPQVLKPDELRRVLQVLTMKNRDLIPFVVIGAFAGVRAAEITRMRWEEHINLRHGLIQLPSEITKTNRRRGIEMEPVLKEWLSGFADQKGDVVPFSNVHRSLATALKNAGIEWPHNCLRHGFASYHLSLHRNAAATALALGNSVGMLETNYKQLVTPSDAKRWFGVTPYVVKNGWPDNKQMQESERDVAAEIGAPAELARAS